MEANIKFEPSFYKKTGPMWKEVINGVLEDLALEGEKRCKEECPVDTGNLRNGHSVDLSGNLEKKILNNVNYWTYVVYGTSRQDANDYPMRVIDSMVNGNVIHQSLEKQLRKRGMK